VTQAKDGSNFLKAAATFQRGAKTLPQRYFISPEFFSEGLKKIFATNGVLVAIKASLSDRATISLRK